MSRDWDGIERRQSLRAEAEAMVSNVSPGETTAQPMETLLHELLVHKVELEIQNEELRRAHLDLEEARDRYVDLYEFAPVAYITVNRDCLISEINLTGSTLLGSDRATLINRRFSHFITASDQDSWYRLFMGMMGKARGDKQSVKLSMTRGDGSTFAGYLDCLRRETADSRPELRIALTDLSTAESGDSEEGGA